MRDEIVFGTRVIAFELAFAERRSLGISVLPDGKVMVKAPVGASLEKIKAKLVKKAPWILKQQSFFLSFEPKTPARKYVGGETHLYLGRQYRLKIESSEPESVKLKGRFLIVSSPDTSRVKVLLDAWYLDHARIKFELIAAPLVERFKKYGVLPHSISIRKMPTRWGSCTAKGKIILNPELIKAPKGCIEYVIVHELCHLVHHDHTRRFVELQAKEMRDWEKWRGKLNSLMA